MAAVLQQQKKKTAESLFLTGKSAAVGQQHEELHSLSLPLGGKTGLFCDRCYVLKHKFSVQSDRVQRKYHGLFQETFWKHGFGFLA